VSRSGAALLTIVIAAFACLRQGAVRTMAIWKLLSRFSALEYRRDRLAATSATGSAAAIVRWTWISRSVPTIRSTPLNSFKTSAGV